MIRFRNLPSLALESLGKGRKNIIRLTPMILKALKSTGFYII